MSKSGRKFDLPHLDQVKVDIIADPNGSGGVRWSNDIKTSGHNHGGHLKIPHGGGAKIEFNLRDNTDLGIRFDASGPFFVEEGCGGSCPTSFNSSQCMVDSCEDDELVVLDWNSGAACELHYQLNFVNEAGERISPYDPIIQNGGGGRPPQLR